MFFISQIKLSLIVNWLSVYCFLFNDHDLFCFVGNGSLLPFLCSLLMRYNSGMESANGTVLTASDSLIKQWFGFTC